MNERIQKLYIQVVGDDKLNFDSYLAEKFAELIVRECSQIAHNSHPDDLPFVGGKMLVHFGVE